MKPAARPVRCVVKLDISNCATNLPHDSLNQMFLVLHIIVTKAEVEVIALSWKIEATQEELNVLIAGHTYGLGK